MNHTGSISSHLVRISLILLAASCAGTPNPDDLQDVNVQVTFPTGTNFTATSLETPYGTSSLNGTSGKLSLSGAGPALASVTNTGGVLLMGFVSPTQTKLNARTTADVLAFYALNGQFLEPAMQSSLLEYLANNDALLPVASAVETTLRGSPPNVSVDHPPIKAALEAMKTRFATQSNFRPLSVTVTPEYQSSGIFVRETARFADAVNIFNNFRREVFVYVDRTDPQPGAVTSFALEGASVETPDAAQRLQALAGFAQGDVPRSAIKSEVVTTPALNDANTTYTVTIVGAGRDPLPAGLDGARSQKARDVALKTAIERFLMPTMASALEAGAKQRSAADITSVLQGLSSATIEKIEAGNFAEGVTDAFRDLFNSAQLASTVDRMLSVYYPGIRSRDGLANMRSRLTRNLSSLIGATAASVSLNNNGIISTINQSKRVETISLVVKPVKLRVLPEQSHLGKGGETILSAQLQLPQGESADGITYRWTLTGVGAGYAVDGGSEKVFGFETTNTTVTYKHRDTINVVYGTDTITVEALRTIDNTPTVIARGVASVTVRESTIQLSPGSAELAFSEEQTFTAIVNPAPASGTLSYTFVTFGPSTFVGGAQTSVGSSNTVRFRQADDTVGAEQPVTVTVVLDNAGTQTILGQARAVVKVKQEPSLQNGDFSQNLSFWNVVNVRGGRVAISSEVSFGCLPSQTGNPFVYLDVYSNQDAYIEQRFKVPANASTLSLRVWNSLDPVVATISLNSTILEQFTPPSLQKLRDPRDLRSVICTGNSPVTRSYNISSFRGQTVTLRLRANNAPGINGTILIFDDVKVNN